MSKEIRAILIDAEREEVKEVTWDGDFRSLSKLIGCEWIEVVGLSRETSLIIDEEGKLKEHNGFSFRGGNYEFAGNGLILGRDSSGESIATRVSVDYVKQLVVWGQKEQAPKTYHSEESDEDDPVMGRVHVIRMVED